MSESVFYEFAKMFFAYSYACLAALSAKKILTSEELEPGMRLYHDISQRLDLLSLEADTIYRTDDSSFQVRVSVRSTEQTVELYSEKFQKIIACHRIRTTKAFCSSLVVAHYN